MLKPHSTLPQHTRYLCDWYPFPTQPSIQPSTHLFTSHAAWMARPTPFLVLGVGTSSDTSVLDHFFVGSELADKEAGVGQLLEAEKCPQQDLYSRRLREGSPSPSGLYFGNSLRHRYPDESISYITHRNIGRRISVEAKVRHAPYQYSRLSSSSTRSARN